MTDYLTIAIADRNPHIRSFLRKEFMARGYRVAAAKDGKELMAMLDSGRPPDLVIMDVDLPHKNGLQVMEWLEDHQVSVPVIIHTCYTEFMGHSSLRGAEEFLEKTGNNIEHLKSTVDRLLLRVHREKVESLFNGRQSECVDTDGP